MLPDVTFEAAFLRAALLLGVVHERDLAPWAEALLLTHGEAHGLLSDVLMANVELTAMREALRPLAEAADADTVCAALLTFLADDADTQALSVSDAVRVLSLMRTELRLRADHAWSGKEFEDRLMLANGGVKGAVAPTRAEIDLWLARVRHPAVFRLSCSASDEAAAFLGALSRKIVRDRRSVAWEPVPGARVWIIPWQVGAPVTLVLNEAAWQVTLREFAPLPIGCRIPYAAVPDDALLAFDGSHGVRDVSSDLAALRGD